MSFVDHASITIKSGDGGPGSSSFRREKFVPMGGPDGGDGGRGGDVVIKVTPHLQTLLDLSLKRNYKAKNGMPGGKKQMFGCDAPPCIIEVPVGTMVFDENGELLADLVEKDQIYIPLVGGKGGKGNQHFSTSSNRAPRYCQSGLPGEEKVIRLEIRLLAQIGLIGLPNAGKSTLLKALTKANAKIADYPFTTLFPNLGVLKFPDREWILADIPGLIEGASEGHGLGNDFLRHVDRTEVLVHVVAMDSDDHEKAWREYLTVQDELKKSPFSLSDRPCVIALNKGDLIPEEDIEIHAAPFKDKGLTFVVISGLAHQGLTPLIREIETLMNRSEMEVTHENETYSRH